jgi:hypothetical protein
MEISPDEDNQQVNISVEARWKIHHDLISPKHTASQG